MAEQDPEKVLLKAAVKECEAQFKKAAARVDALMDELAPSILPPTDEKVALYERALLPAEKAKAEAKVALLEAKIALATHLEEVATTAEAKAEAKVALVEAKEALREAKTQLNRLLGIESPPRGVASSSSAAAAAAAAAQDEPLAKRRRSEPDWRALVRPYDDYPESDVDLRKLLAQKLNPHFPLRRDFLPDGHLSEDFDDFFVDEDLALRSDAAKALAVFFFTKSSLSGTENTCQINFDSTVRGILSVFVSLAGPAQVESGRNETTGESGTNRPDFNLKVDGVCLFYGEEKGGGHGLDGGMVDLRTKLAWTSDMLGDQLPYLLGYSGSGAELQLCAILRGGTVMNVTAPLNLSMTADRLVLLRALVHVARLLPVLRGLVPAGSYPLRSRWERHGCTLFFEAEHVKKVVRPGAIFSKPGDLHQLYSSDFFSTLPSTVKMTKAIKLREDGALELCLGPIGKAVDPSALSLEEVVWALADVLEALGALHARGWCHRDVRWPNVIRLPLRADMPGEGAAAGGTRRPRFMLIDFECAALIGAQVPEQLVKAPAGSSRGYMPFHDLIMVMVELVRPVKSKFDERWDPFLTALITEATTAPALREDLLKCR